MYTHVYRKSSYLSHDYMSFINQFYDLFMTYNHRKGMKFYGMRNAYMVKKKQDESRTLTKFPNRTVSKWFNTNGIKQMV